MPLIALCGYPCSGKSTIAQILMNMLREQGHKVLLLRNTEFGYCPSTTLYSAAEEKTVRAGMLGAVEKSLDKITTIIVDGNNEIKGYRYQLYCTARAIPTPHLVLHVSTPVEQCRLMNAQRDPASRYPSQILDQLILRFETPNPKTKWDSPLVTAALGDDLAPDHLCKLLYQFQPPKPRPATVPKPYTDTGYFVTMDKIINSVLEEMYVAPCSISRTDGQRYKRQFIAFNKHNHIPTPQLCLAFIQFVSELAK